MLRGAESRVARDAALQVPEAGTTYVEVSVLVVQGT